jgi:DNA-binding FadR family transcriptional regulator
VLGPKTAELAALNPDRELVARTLKRALEADRCAYTVSPDEEILDFHRAINMLSGNPALGLLMDTVESIIVNHIVHLTPTADRMPWIHSDHEDITEAILAGDSQRAHDLSARHLEFSVKYYRELNHGSFTATVQWR